MEMTPDRLSQLKRDMTPEERFSRYEECLNTGGCEQFLFDVSTGDEYCSNCLTLFIDGLPQDPPSPA